MAVLQRLRERLAADERGRELDSYQCLGCGSTFRSPASAANQVSCPECGVGRVRTAGRPAE